MNLSVIIPEIKSQNFACHGCTNCCRDLVVHLTPEDQRKIDKQNWGDRIDGPAYVRLRNELVLNHSASGGCVFLLPDGKCRIHAEFGATAKPLACQLFPFTLDPEVDGLRAGLRFDCPTVARNSGQKIGTFRKDLGRIAEELKETAPQVFAGDKDRVFLTDQRPCSPQEMQELTSRLDEWLANTNRSLRTRLHGLIKIVQTLRNAELGRLDSAKLIELIKLLFDEAGAASKNADDFVPPTNRQQKLLLQAVYSHCEQITLRQAQHGGLSALMYRWQQLRRSQRLSIGAGLIPPLVAGVGSVEHEFVNRIDIDSAQAVPVDELVSRYLRVKVLSHGVFGHSYYGWTIVDGLSAMLLALAVIGWLSRYFAASQSSTRFGIEHVIRAIGVVDRAAGRVPVLGSRSARLRLTYLSADVGTQRLIDRFSLWSDHRDGA